MIARKTPLRCAAQGWDVRPMRWVIRALLVVALAPCALADDFDVLRGSQPVGPATFTRWSGLYLGGQVGFGDANADFSKATQPLVAFSLRELALENQQHPSQWPVLGKASNDSFGGGGFVGYNTQWQDLVLGLEGNYTRTAFAATAPSSPIARVVSAGGNTYSVFLSGTGSLDLTDYASLRARAGWALGNFLPYGFVGFALGRADFSVTSHVFGQQNSASPAFFPCNPAAPTCVGFDFSNSVAQNGALLYGLSAGGGLDWTLTSNIFLRGELELVQFAALHNIVVSIISARAGAGLKF